MTKPQLIQMSILAICLFFYLLQLIKTNRKKKSFSEYIKIVEKFILEADRNSIQAADKAGDMVESLYGLIYNSKSRSEAVQQFYCWRAKFKHLYSSNYK